MCEGIRQSEASRYPCHVSWMASGSGRLPLCPGTRCRAAPAGKSAQIERSKFNSFPIERGIAFDDLVNGCALFHHVSDQVHGDSRATIDGRAAHRLLVFDDQALCELEFLEPLIEFSADGLDLNHQGAAF